MPAHRAPLVLALVSIAGLIVLSTSGSEARSKRQAPPESKEIIEHLTPEELIQRAAGIPERLPLGVVRVRLPTAIAPAFQELGPMPVGNEAYSGPGDAAGRISSIVVDPRDTTVVYIAAAGGGVWKSTDSGSNWKVLTDNLSSLASGALALDPTFPDIVYYATGEQHFSGDSKFGDGLFRSTDGGATWEKRALRADVGSYCARVVVQHSNPDLPAVVYIASDRGVVRSTDEGINWQVTRAGVCTDLVLNAANDSILYASIYGGGIYKSTDAGETWGTPLGGGLPGAGFARINLAISPSVPRVLYAAFVRSPSPDSLLDVYRTRDAGATWTALNNTTHYLGEQGNYDNCIAVDPGDTNVVYAGGAFPDAASPYDSLAYTVIKSTNGGGTWAPVGAGLHVDQHYLAFAPNGALWVANDGGLWKSNTGGASWRNRNNRLGITQLYATAAHANRDSLVGGSQDNGGVVYTGTRTWPQPPSGAGDGVTAVTRRDSTFVFYISQPFLQSLFKYVNGAYSATVDGGWVAAGDRTQFAQNPFVADPNNTLRLFVGTHRVWRSTNGGSSWASISPDLTSGGAGRIITGLAAAPGRPQTIYATTSDGRVQRSTNGGGGWNRRDTGLPATTLLDPTVSPSDSNVVYVIATNPGGGQVFKTTDGGGGWSDQTGDLPAALMALALAVDFESSPTRLFVGTDVGLYVSDDGSGTWTQVTSVPNVQIYDLALDTKNCLISAGTHGRGVWRAALDTIPPDVAIDSPLPGEQWLVGSSQCVSWIAQAESLTVVLSRDGGATFPDTLGRGVPNDPPSVCWTVTGPLSNDCRVKVLAWDKCGNVGSSISDQFAIVDSATVVEGGGGSVDANAPRRHALLPVTETPDGQTIVRYEVPAAGRVSLVVYDVYGRRVRGLEDASRPAGQYRVTWNGRDALGRRVASGVYVIRMEAGSFQAARKVVTLP